MPSYRVTWVVDIYNDDVNTHVLAAKTALGIMRDPESIATVFTVQDENGGTPVSVDLAEVLHYRLCVRQQPGETAHVFVVHDDDSDNPPPGIVCWIGDWQEVKL